MSQVLQNEISGWDSWNAKKYLDTFYSIPKGDTFVTLDFITDELHKYRDKPFETALEFGSGPTLLGVLATAPYVKRLHVADFLQQNLDEITQWLMCEDGAFNWNTCTEYLLKKEGINPTPETIAKKYSDLRGKIKKLLRGDITQNSPLLNHQEHYDLLVSLFCADSITDSKIQWRQYMKNLFSLAAPKGTIIIGALRNCPFYRVGDRYFPCAKVNEKDLEDLILEENHIIEDFAIRVNEVEDCLDEGFTSVMFARITLK